MRGFGEGSEKIAKYLVQLPVGVVAEVAEDLRGHDANVAIFDLLDPLLALPEVDAV